MYKVGIKQLDSHAHLALFINHALAGELVLKTEELPHFLYLLAAEQGGTIFTPRTMPGIIKQARELMEDAGYDLRLQ